MTAITEAALKKYWLVGALVAAAAAWATSLYADVNSLKGSVAEMKDEQRDTSNEVRLLREAMIRAGTARDAPKGG